MKAGPRRPMVCAVVPVVRPGLVRQWPDSQCTLLAGDVVEQVAQGEGVLVAVVPPCRAGIGTGKVTQMVLPALTEEMHAGANRTA
jgi:hypothetical protein